LRIYIDGQYYSKEDAKVSVFDHGFLYGDGVFEGIRAYNGRVFRLKQHVDRLYESAAAIHLSIPTSRPDLCRLVVETVRANEIRDGYIRLIVSRGPGDLGLDPRQCPTPSIIIIAGKIQLYPKECYDSGIEILTCATRRNRPDALNPTIKSLNYLNNILAKIEVSTAHSEKKPRLLEGLMLNADGKVAECTGDNIFYVTGGGLHTPPPSDGILRGVTRQAVLELAREAGIPVVEQSCTQLDLYAAEECFVTGTGAEMIPVVQIDDRPIGDGQPGPVTQQLRARFAALVAAEGVRVYAE